jgi:hypothetical protein
MRLEHGAGLHAAHLDIVEGQVIGAGVLDQAVVGDDRNALIGGGLHGGPDRRGVLRQDDQRVDALRDQAFHVESCLAEDDCASVEI